MAMRNQDIERLIEKYYNGETSLEEEQALDRYYNEEGISSVVDGDRTQFIYFNFKRKEEPGSTFSSKLESFTFLETKRVPINLALFFRIAAVLILGIGIGWFLFRSQYNTSERRITTTSREQKNITLPDGSLVWLNGMTELEYDDAFDHEKREVYLKGEAYFEVVRNSSKPFIVSTQKVKTEVLGTSFSLRSYPQEEAIELNVITGKVIFGKTKKIEVSNGTQVYFNAFKDNIEKLKANPNAISWKTKELIFEDALMSNVVQDLERYYNTRLEIETPGFLNCHFKGSFKNPQLEDILKVIAYSLNVKYSLRNGTYFLQGQNCEVK
jgi:ferric-dicitrate binding protein FerR (iron transport regulator)